jgi:hypothetical protein
MEITKHTREVVLMTNLIIAGVITTLIIGYRCVKRWVDTKCQENFDVGFKLGKMVSNAINKYEEEK